MTQRPTIRPIPQAPSRRIMSTTPMPQMPRRNTFRPVTRSPPPFEAPNPSLRPAPDDIFGRVAPQLQQPTNIALLSRGITLLSITQLRDLLRDYSLPTGGNKHVLVNRLIIFLETFGQNQQNILSAFSAKLKRLLSVEAEDPSSSSPHEESIPQQVPVVSQQIPQDVVQSIFSQTPSCLYEPTDVPPAYGPVVIQPNFGSTSFNFNITNVGTGVVPILQFSPSYIGGVVSRVVIQINGVFLNLRSPGLWSDMKDFIDRPGSFQIISIDPAVPVVATIRWVKPVPVQQLILQIAQKDPPPKMPASGGPITGVCPLTRKIIVRPARGATCMHGECFDLTGFICSSMKNNTWQCPICRKPLSMEELRIDPYFFALASGVQV